MNMILKKILFTLIPKKEQILGYIIAVIASVMAFFAGVNAPDILDAAQKQKPIVIEDVKKIESVENVK